MEQTKLPHCPRKGETYSINIEQMSDEGMGIGYLSAAVGPQEQARDLEFHVRKAVPGDTVKMEVEIRRGDYVEGHILEWLEHSSSRIDPRCSHFGRREQSGEGCGGCTLQSISYEDELDFKADKVKRALAHHNLTTEQREIIGHRPPWFYRNNMELTFGDTAERNFAFGLYPKGYHHEILNLDECYLQSEFTSDFIPAVREWANGNELEPYINSDDEGFLRTLTVREGKNTGQRWIHLVTTGDESTRMNGQVRPAKEVAKTFVDFVRSYANETGADLTSVVWSQKFAARGQPTEYSTECLYGRDTLKERLEIDGTTLDFEIPPFGFFQTNTDQAQILYEEVLDAARQTGKHGLALDLYCGTGTIGLILSQLYDRVVGIERQKEAVDCADENARINDIRNVDFMVGPVRDKLDELSLESAPDLAVVDPPRNGLKPEALKTLTSTGAETLIYVSCNPSSFARDAEKLVEGDLELEYVQPVDMFPQTYHVELVGRFS